MKTLELLLGFWCLSVSLAELNLHLIEVSLHLLLQSESFIPAASLWFKWALQGINHSLLVPLDCSISSSFSASLRSMSALIWLNSSWALRSFLLHAPGSPDRSKNLAIKKCSGRQPVDCNRQVDHYHCPSSSQKLQKNKYKNPLHFSSLCTVFVVRYLFWCYLRELQDSDKEKYIMPESVNRTLAEARDAEDWRKDRKYSLFTMLKI